MEILLNIEDKQLYQICQISKQIYQLCQSKEFLRRKLDQLGININDIDLTDKTNYLKVYDIIVLFYNEVININSPYNIYGYNIYRDKYIKLNTIYDLLLKYHLIEQRDIYILIK
ncbi:MAG TPA: hypothetical protein VLG50_08380 [Candidatus Saccharimonadales bacterium]|nr:hypothetical protein [Candidatus Saccharimonadales bacterium]